MYGRHDAGTSSTMATHQPADTTKATVARTVCQMRRRSPVGAARR